MIVLTVKADTPVQLAPLWELLRGNESTVDIVDGDMVVTVDLDGSEGRWRIGPQDGFLITAPLVTRGSGEKIVGGAEPTGIREDQGQEGGRNSEPEEAPNVQPGTGPAPLPERATKPRPQVVTDPGGSGVSLRQRILNLLSGRKMPAKELAKVTGEPIDDVRAILASLKHAGEVRSAGVAGWALTEPDPITRTPVNHDQARLRAAEGM